MGYGNALLYWRSTPLHDTRPGKKAESCDRAVCDGGASDRALRRVVDVRTARYRQRQPLHHDQADGGDDGARRQSVGLLEPGDLAGRADGADVSTAGAHAGGGGVFPARQERPCDDAADVGEIPLDAASAPELLWGDGVD